MKNIFFLMVLTTTGSVCLGSEPKWTTIFDGKTLNGWKPTSDANWRVEKNAIIVDQGKAGLLVHQDAYKNYELALEFKAARGTNSGVFLSTKEKPKNLTTDCYELNIAPPDNPFPTGSLVQRKKVVGAGETDAWRRYQVRVANGRVTVKLDSDEILDHRAKTPAIGTRIALQKNSGRVAFRNIRVRKLLDVGQNAKATDAVQRAIDRFPLGGVIRSAIGVTRQGRAIPCFIGEDHFDPATEKFRILIIGGLDGTAASVDQAMSALSEFLGENELQKRYTVSCVPCARPDAITQSNPAELRFPPKGNAYNQPGNDEAHYLWRWIGMHAPDLVIDVRSESDAVWIYPDKSAELLETIRDGLVGIANETAGEGSLVAALSQGAPAEVGSIPALQSGGKSFLLVMTAAIDEHCDSPPTSGARQELNRRIARSPIEVAQELAEVYGGKLDKIMYIPALAVIGRMRLGELNGRRNRFSDAEKLAAPFRSGNKESMPAKGNGSTLSGHLVFSELARRAGKDSWEGLAKKAADYGFDANGHPKESMPFHNEMSDSVFMGCAILAEVGALTGDEKYFVQCLRHLKFMQNLCLREDGIYRHSPLDEAAWGRGNGFPSLGMALSLSVLPEDSEAFAFFLKSYRAHLEALKEHQDPTGAWHQVIDRDESYREFTSTCMITFAIVRGIRSGWLEEKEWGAGR